MHGPESQSWGMDVDYGYPQSSLLDTEAETEGSATFNPGQPATSGSMADLRQVQSAGGNYPMGLGDDLFNSDANGWILHNASDDEYGSDTSVSGSVSDAGQTQYSDSERTELGSGFDLAVPVADMYASGPWKSHMSKIRIKAEEALGTDSESDDFHQNPACASMGFTPGVTNKSGRTGQPDMILTSTTPMFNVDHAANRMPAVASKTTRQASLTAANPVPQRPVHHPPAVPLSADEQRVRKVIEQLYLRVEDEAIRNIRAAHLDDSGEIWTAIQTLLLEDNFAFLDRPQFLPGHQAIFRESPKRRRKFSKATDKWQNSGGVKGSRRWPLHGVPQLRCQYGKVISRVGKQPRKYREYFFIAEGNPGLSQEKLARHLFHVLPELPNLSQTVPEAQIKSFAAVTVAVPRAFPIQTAQAIKVPGLQVSDGWGAKYTPGIMTVDADIDSSMEVGDAAHASQHALCSAAFREAHFAKLVREGNVQAVAIQKAQHLAAKSCLTPDAIVDLLQHFAVASDAKEPFPFFRRPAMLGRTHVDTGSNGHRIFVERGKSDRRGLTTGRRAEQGPNGKPKRPAQPGTDSWLNNGGKRALVNLTTKNGTQLQQRGGMVQRRKSESKCSEYLVDVEDEYKASDEPQRLRYWQYRVNSETSPLRNMTVFHVRPLDDDGKQRKLAKRQTSPEMLLTAHSQEGKVEKRPNREKVAQGIALSGVLIMVAVTLVFSSRYINGTMSSKSSELCSEGWFMDHDGYCSECSHCALRGLLTLLPCGPLVDTICGKWHKEELPSAPPPGTTDFHLPQFAASWTIGNFAYFFGGSSSSRDGSTETDRASQGQCHSDTIGVTSEMWRLNTRLHPASTLPSSSAWESLPQSAAAWPSARSGAAGWSVRERSAGLLFGGDYTLCDHEYEGLPTGSLLLPPDDLMLHNESGWFQLGGEQAWTAETTDAITQAVKNGYSMRQCAGCASPHGSSSDAMMWPLARARAQHWQLGDFSLMFSGQFSGPFVAQSQPSPVPGAARFARELRKTREMMLGDMWRFIPDGQTFVEDGLEGITVVQRVAWYPSYVDTTISASWSDISAYPAARIDAATWVTGTGHRTDTAWMFGGFGQRVEGRYDNRYYRLTQGQINMDPTQDGDLTSANGNLWNAMTNLCDLWRFSFAAGWTLVSVCERDRPFLLSNRRWTSTFDDWGNEIWSSHTKTPLLPSHLLRSGDDHPSTGILAATWVEPSGGSLWMYGGAECTILPVPSITGVAPINGSVLPRAVGSRVINITDFYYDIEKAEALPAEWQMFADSLSGEIYYHNTRTGETTWVHPRESELRTKQGSPSTCDHLTTSWDSFGEGSARERKDQYNLVASHTISGGYFGPGGHGSPCPYGGVGDSDGLLNNWRNCAVRAPCSGVLWRFDLASETWDQVHDINTANHPSAGQYAKDSHAQDATDPPRWKKEFTPKSSPERSCGAHGIAPSLSDADVLQPTLVVGGWSGESSGECNAWPSVPASLRSDNGSVVDWPAWTGWYVQRDDSLPATCTGEEFSQAVWPHQELDYNGDGTTPAQGCQGIAQRTVDYGIAFALANGDAPTSNCASGRHVWELGAVSTTHSPPTV